MPCLSAHAFTAGVALAFCALGFAPASAQNGTQTPTVVVAVFKDYPVFIPSERNRAGPDLRAIVIPTDLVDKTRSIVILNPDHVRPEVLYAALRRLYATPLQNRRSGTIGVTRRTTPERSALDPSTLAALKGVIRDLMTTPPSRLRGHPFGKHIVINETLRKAVEGNTR